MADNVSFSLFDCSLLRSATGRACTNLRELAEAVRNVPQTVLEHHMMRCPLEDHFDLYEFPNDLARWCWDALGLHALGEELGLIDPYRFNTMDDLRGALLGVIEGQLWDTTQVAASRPGLELHLIESRLVAYDTGERFKSPAALVEAISRMSSRSLFFHVHEARRRSGNRTDDLSSWLEAYGAAAELVEGIRQIDFYFLNLNQLREEILRVFKQYLPEPEVALQVPA